MYLGELFQAIEDIKGIYPFTQLSDISIECGDMCKATPTIVTIKEYVDEDYEVTVKKRVVNRIQL